MFEYPRQEYWTLYLKTLYIIKHIWIRDFRLDYTYNLESVRVLGIRKRNDDIIGFIWNFALILLFETCRKCK